MKVWQIVGMIEADGWYLVRTRGIHHQYRLMTMSDYERQAENYLILIEGGPPSNFSAWSPDLPGCAATGDTIEESVMKMKEAIALHLEGLEEDGDPIPDPTGPGVYVAHDPVAAA